MSSALSIHKNDMFSIEHIRSETCRLKLTWHALVPKDLVDLDILKNAATNYTDRQIITCITDLIFIENWTYFVIFDVRMDHTLKIFMDLDFMWMQNFNTSFN